MVCWCLRAAQRTNNRQFSHINGNISIAFMTTGSVIVHLHQLLCDAYTVGNYIEELQLYRCRHIRFFFLCTCHFDSAFSLFLSIVPLCQFPVDVICERSVPFSFLPAFSFCGFVIVPLTVLFSVFSWLWFVLIM